MNYLNAVPIEYQDNVLETKYCYPIGSLNYNQHVDVMYSLNNPSGVAYVDFRVPDSW